MMSDFTAYALSGTRIAGECDFSLTLGWHSLPENTMS